MNRRQRRANSKLRRDSSSSRSEFGTSNILPASAELLRVGLSHHQARRLTEAEACYRRVLTVQPDHAGTYYNLGVVLHDQDKPDEAIAAYRQAIRISQNFMEAHINLGKALIKEGKLEEATEAFREAVRIKPNDSDAHFNLGVVLRKQRAFDAATRAYRQVIRIKPDHAESHCDLGIALHDLGRLDEAIASYRKAIVLKPNFADAHNGLGTALMDQGHLPKARKALENAVRLAPDNARYRRGVSIITRFADGDPRLTEMERLVEDGARRSVDERIELHFALGKAYDDIGRHAEAFRQWLSGNTLKRQQITYNEASTLEELDRVRSVFSSELIRTSQNTGHPSSVPVFIVGMPRSGTTLVEQILASHPQVFGGGELPYFKKVIESVLPTSGSSAAAGGIRELGKHYVAGIEKLAPNASHVTDKMPNNFIFVGLIHLALPNARIIHVSRDATDTCLSCFSKLFAEEQDFTYDLVELGRYYRRYDDLMTHWHDVLPPRRILDVCYEDVVADLEGQARRIIAHCGLDWNARCLEFYDTERPVRTASALQVRQPIYQNAVGRWHSYAEFLGPLIVELTHPKPDQMTHSRRK